MRRTGRDGMSFPTLPSIANQTSQKAHRASFLPGASSWYARGGLMRPPTLHNARVLNWAQGLTSHRRLHGGFHHPHKELQALGVLRQARGKRCQGIGMAAQVLEGNTLSEVGLQ